MFAEAEEIVHELLTADVSPVLDAEIVFDPDRSMDKFPNVAIPLALVRWLVVPLSVPVPEESVIATATPESEIAFPN